MACTCKDINGLPTDRCTGVCAQNKNSSIINPETQNRAQDDGFNSRQIDQIVSAVSHVFKNSNLHDLHRDLWVDGFLRGFEEGRTLQ